MSAITQPASSGTTAQAESASIAVTSGASRKMPLFAPAGMIGSLKTNLRRSAKGCSRPEGPDDVRPAPHLHRRPDLAVGIEDVGDEDEQRHDQEEALAEHDQRRGRR